MKPSIPTGTRDFNSTEVNRRNYIYDTIKKVYTKFGFQPIETPAMEKLSTLTGKYGEEGDKLLFKILNNGDYLSKADEKLLSEKDSAKLISQISSRGLRYDLTVPFARFVVMHQHALTFPFKRYQIQPVWRADRPQKGRYREFFQCDADVVGSDALLHEAEFVQIFDEVFTALKINATVRINNRKVLAGMAEVAGISDRFMEMTIAIDKLDKIGADGVKREMQKREIDDNAIEKVLGLLKTDDLSTLKELLAASETGLKGVEELETVFDLAGLTAPKTPIKFDITLARGLNYYTGCIFEVTANDVKMGSIAGGGRYDDLTSVFGLKNMSGVGISFGADRLYDCLEELGLFPESIDQTLDVLFIAFDPSSHRYAFNCLNQVRSAGIASELYPVPAKMKKQMKYANDRKVPYVVLIGSNEVEEGLLTFKNMESGEQEKLSLEAIIERLA